MFIFIVRAKRFDKERQINSRLDDYGLYAKAETKTAAKNGEKKEQKREVYKKYTQTKDIYDGDNEM